MALIEEKIKLIYDRLVEKQRSDTYFYDEIMDLLADIKILSEAKTSALENIDVLKCPICLDSGWYFTPNFGGGGVTHRCLCGGEISKIKNS